MTIIKHKQKIQIVTVAKNQVLLLQFAKYHNNGFQNITGSVEENETFLEAAHRELFEEIAINNNLIDINHSFYFSDRWGFSVEEKVYLCNLLELPAITLSQEHQSYKWIPVEKVVEKDFVFPTNFEALLKALEFINA
jgi:8-oxo-dGTP pyrophosphatase MutT (NUDIX family)